MLRRIRVLILLAACFSPATAAADWIVSPYLGARFAASSTSLVGFEATEQNNKFTFGSGIGLLGAGIFGVEADIGFIPGFFESGVVTRGGGVTTVMGNVIVATPLALSQYGLRPYAVGGLGWVHAGGAGDIVGNVIDNDLFGMNVGGGALGPVSPHSSLRFDLRYFHSLGGDAEVTTMPGAGLELSFWRGTVGVTYRF